MVLEKEKKLLLFGLLVQGLVILAFTLFQGITIHSRNSADLLFASVSSATLAASTSFFHLLQHRKKLVKLNVFRPLPILFLQILVFAVSLVLLILQNRNGFLPPSVPRYILSVSLIILLINKASVPFRDKAFRITEQLLYQASAITVLIYLLGPKEDGFVIVMALVILNIVFSTLQHLRKLSLPRIISHLFTVVLISLLSIEHLSVLIDLEGDEIWIRLGGFLILFLLIFGSITLQNRKRQKKSFPDRNIIDGLLPLFPVLISISLSWLQPWTRWIAPNLIIFPALMGLMLLRKNGERTGLGIGLTLSLYTLCLYEFLFIHFSDLLSPLQALTGQIPLVILLIFSIRYSPILRGERSLQPFSLYLFAGYAASMLYHFLYPVSEFFPGLAWLFLAIVLMEASLFITQKNTRNEKSSFHLKLSSFLLIPVFLLRHFIVHTTSDLMILRYIPARMAVSFLTLLVFLYLLFRIKKDKKEPLPIRIFQNLFLEISLGLTLITLLLEVPGLWWSLTLSLTALLLYLSGLIKNEKISRLRVYSLFLFWSVSILLPLLTFHQRSNPVYRFSLDWFLALCAFISQTIYIALFYLKNGLEKTLFPKAFPRFTPLVNGVQRWRNYWIFYPVFISAALFCWWSFDKTILTVCFFSEAFLIFILSVLLKENHFRHLSTVALLASLVRLIFFDLSRSNTVIKAVVFIAVALLMILMNVIYNRYKARFMKKRE